MLRGRFGNTSGRPYIEGRLVIPSLNVQGQFSFLIDTGADSTFLAEDDASLLRIDHSKLTEHRESWGVGGKSVDRLVEAYLAFDDRTHLFIYKIDLTVAEPDGTTMGLPSLLGRDVLSYWDIRYDFESRRLDAEVHSAYVIRHVGSADPPSSPQVGRD